MSSDQAYVPVAPLTPAELLDVMAQSLGPASERYVSVHAAPGRATLADLEWEWRAGRQRDEALTTTRVAGEKWAAALASLTGVFAIVVLIKGPEDISKVVGSVGDWLPDRVASEAWRGSLFVVALVAFVVALLVMKGHESLARRWGVAVPLGVVVVGCGLLLALTPGDGGRVTDGTWMAVFLLAAIALLGLGVGISRLRPGLKPYRPVTWIAAVVCVVLAGFALSQGLASWETIVMVSLGCAIGLAGLSIVGGARTAYGPVSPPPAPSGGLLRVQQRAEVRRSRRWLLLAIYSAVTAVGLLGLAIAITWTQTPDEPRAPGDLLVLRTGGQPAVCGAFEGNRDDAVLIRGPKSAAPETVPLADIRALTVVDSCPERR